MLILFCSLSACRRAQEGEAQKETTVSIKNTRGFTLFKATTDGPFLISISGADVEIKMLEEEPGLEKNIEKEAKKAKK